jgi:hypothetical protein
MYIYQDTELQNSYELIMNRMEVSTEIESIRDIRTILLYIWGITRLVYPTVISMKGLI